MEQPPFGQEVVAMLDDNSEVLAMWIGEDGWVVGVDDDPIDRPLQGNVIDWRWRTD